MQCVLVLSESRNLLIPSLKTVSTGVRALVSFTYESIHDTINPLLSCQAQGRLSWAQTGQTCQCTCCTGLSPFIVPVLSALTHIKLTGFMQIILCTALASELRVRAGATY
jgi:hypothetical protein